MPKPTVLCLNPQFEKQTKLTAKRLSYTSGAPKRAALAQIHEGTGRNQRILSDFLVNTKFTLK